MNKISLPYDFKDVFDKDYNINKKGVNKLISDLTENLKNKSEELKKANDARINSKISAETWLQENSSNIENIIKGYLVDTFNENYKIIGHNKKLTVKDITNINYIDNINCIFIMCRFLNNQNYVLKLEVYKESCKNFIYRSKFDEDYESIQFTLCIPKVLHDNILIQDLIKLFIKGFTTIKPIYIK